MIDLKLHCDIDASVLTVQTSAAFNLLEKVKQHEMSGWITLPEDYNKAEFARIKAAAEQIRSDSKYLVCIGIGGSYLGHKAIIEALGNNSSTKILYAGNSLSERSIQNILDQIDDSDFSINVISKSGTTLEPAAAFRIFKQKLFEKYGEEEAKKRIYATTDANSGALHDEALFNHYERFVVPDNIGGRFSVLTAVGLLPCAVAGVNIDDLMTGAREEYGAIKNQDSSYEISSSITENIYKYAAVRHIFRSRNYDVEVLASFEPSMEFFTKWWQQLFGESEGKEDKGIYPATSIYTTDLHSLGQYMQQGRPNIFETFISFKKQPVTVKSSMTAPLETIYDKDSRLIIPKNDDNLDGLQYLEEKTLANINDVAKTATIKAHSKHIPVLELIMPDLSARSLGSLIYFFEFSCAISAMLEQVDPFNQPGVESYKQEMFKLLDRPED